MAINVNFRVQYSTPPGSVSKSLKRNSQRFQRDLARQLQQRAQEIYQPEFNTAFRKHNYGSYKAAPGKGAPANSVIRNIGAEILTRARRRGGQVVHIGIGALVQGARAMPLHKQAILAHMEGLVANRPGGEAKYGEIEEWFNRKGITAYGEADPVKLITNAINQRGSHRYRQPFVSRALASKSARRRIQYAARKLYQNYFSGIGTRVVRRRSGAF